MKKIFRTSLAILLISVAVGSTALATPSVNQLKEDKKKAQKELDQIKKDITNLMTNINKGEQQLVEVGQAVIKAEADLAEAEEKEQIQYEAMKHRIVAMYENGTGMMLAKVLDAGNLAEMIKQAEHVQTIHEYDRKQLAEYVAVKQKIANLKESLENDMAVIQKQQKQFEKDKASLNRKISQLQGKISNFDEEIRKAAQNSGSGGGSSSGSGYVPPVGTGGGAAIVKEAYRYLGAMYVWGGESLSGVDCSGLVKMAHKAIGVNLPHYSNSIGSGGRKVSKSEALPGDVVCYYGHVGIYLGNGMMIHAPDFGQRVRVQAVYGSPWYRRYW